MNLKNIFGAALAAIAVFAGCAKNDPMSLNDIKVSSSYVALPQGTEKEVEEGKKVYETTITLNAKSDWKFEEWVDEKKDGDAKGDWLSISPREGKAGEVNITFKAKATLNARSLELNLVAGGEKQIINVMQGVPAITTAKCEEVILGPEGKVYQITGICTRISNTTYGNWYINDGTGEVYIYGTVNDKGAYDWAKFNIEVGDEVTVVGPKKEFNKVAELEDATFIKVNKSLIKVESFEPEDGVIPADGGTIAIRLTNKGQGVKVSVPEQAKSWLSIDSVEGNVVRFKATPNAGGDRQVTLKFGTTDGKKDYSCELTVAQAGRKGTLEIPYTVEEAIELCNKLGGESASNVYIKGIVSKIANNGEFSAKYGNGTFWISSDGEYHDDHSKDFEAFRVLWLGNEFWKEGNAQIAVGAEVIICGKVTLYNGTAETAEKKAYVYSVNSVTTDAEGIGTLAAPFTVKGAIAAANNTPGTNNVFVAGKVSKIESQFSAQFGNATFWISADGKFNDDKTADFEAYQAYALGNKSWKEGDKTVAVGDDVVLCGQITLYKGTAETSGKKAYVYSINGETE